MSFDSDPAPRGSSARNPAPLGVTCSPRRSTSLGRDDMGRLVLFNAAIPTNRYSTPRARRTILMIPASSRSLPPDQVQTDLGSEPENVPQLNIEEAQGLEPSSVLERPRVDRIEPDVVRQIQDRAPGLFIV